MHFTNALVFPNFLLLFYFCHRLGGDALNGYVQAGHYYLHSSHGHYTEVPQSVWSFSYWHTLSAIGGICLRFAVEAILVTTGDIIQDF